MNIFSAAANEIERLQLNGVIEDLQKKLEHRVATFEPPEEDNPEEIFDSWTAQVNAVYDKRAGSDNGDDKCNVAVRRRMLGRIIKTQRDIFLEKCRSLRLTTSSLDESAGNMLILGTQLAYTFLYIS